MPTFVSSRIDMQPSRQPRRIGLALVLSYGAQEPVTGDKDIVPRSEQQEIQQGMQTHKDALAQFGMRMAGLAAHSPVGQYAESCLRLMNRLYPSSEPQPGQLLKVVN
jgi:predicted Zn-dependent protease